MFADPPEVRPVASGIQHVAPDGTVFVAQCANAAAYSVDPTTGAAELVGRAATDFVDNVVRLTDGRVLLSSFLREKSFLVLLL